MIALRRWLGAEPAGVLAPGTDTDSEALAQLADEDPDEAADLDTFRNAKRPPPR